MEYIYVLLGVLFIIAGLAFFFGRTHIQLFAWENMPEQGRGRIMPLCRCMGEVIVLSGEQTLPAIIIRTAALCGRVRF